MKTALAAIIGLAFAMTAAGDQVEDRAKLNGTWEIENGSGKPITWVIEQKDDTAHFANSEGDQKAADFECSTRGRECKIADSGKDAKISMWFNGSSLIQMETKGSDVTKRKFSVTPEGDKLSVEIVPIVPAGKAETLHFKRSQTTTAQK
jgi:hypothetical protein